MTSPKAVGIAAFCMMHGISRSSFYNLRSTGKTPREMRVGSRVLITEEAAADWRRIREAETDESQRPLLVSSEKLCRALANEARLRGVSPQDLLGRILEAVVEGALFDSILDRTAL
jgi:predicted DNA-binding transcriptional regulator AlpA